MPYAFENGPRYLTHREIRLFEYACIVVARNIKNDADNGMESSPKSVLKAVEKATGIKHPTPSRELFDRIRKILQ